MAADGASSVLIADKDRLPWLGELREPVAKKGPGWTATGLSVVVLVGLAGGLAMVWRDMQPFVAADSPVVAVADTAAPSAIEASPVLPDVEAAPTAPPQASHAAPITTTRSVPKLAQRASTRRIETASIDRPSFDRVTADQASSTTVPLATSDRPAKPSMKSAMVDAMAATLSSIPSPSESQLAVSQPSRPVVNPAARVVRKQTVRMGVYLTQAQADVAWKAAVRDYTYLVTMPKQVAPVIYRGRRYYQLNLGTPSRNHAMQLCRNLKSIGHNCSVG